MEKTVKMSSSSLSILNEALQRLTLNNQVKEFTPVIVEANGKFTSVVKPTEEFDPNNLGASIDTEEDSPEAEEKKEDRQKLLNQAKDALKQSLENSLELDEILQKIKELSKDTDYNEWQANKEGNTAILRSKDARIFKQNNNLCLSHAGKIELFHSVEELHKWLKENDYPLPKDNVIIHESVEVKEDRNWVDLLNKHKAEDKNDYTAAPSTKQDKDDFYDGLGKMISKKDYADLSKAKNFSDIKKLNLVKKDQEVEECGGACVGTAALGPAVTYTASPKRSEKKESILTESKPSLIPGDTREFPGWGKAVNAFLSWFGKHSSEIESGEIVFPNDFKSKFEGVIKPIFFQYNASDIMSPIWNSLARDLARSEASIILKGKGIDNTNPNWDNLVVTIGTDILKNPTKEYLQKFAKNVNVYGTEVNLVPGYQIINTENKDNPNYQERKKWETAALNTLYNQNEGKLPAKIKNFKNLENLIMQNLAANKEEPESILDKFTPEEQKLLKAKKVNVNDYTEEELRGIIKLFTNKKSESVIFESAEKHPWLSKILGQRLVEDDTPADFATGQPVIDQLNSVGNSSSTTDTTDTTTDNVDFDIPTGSSSNDKKNFGDINISTGGNYSPDEPEIEEPVPGAPAYKIIDVLASEEDPSDIKVKLQNTEDGSIEVKDLSEIDV